jgi:predicted enzyme related to lactoylglutathione lyase
MAPKLSYVIEFVDDMDRAVKFYSDVIGLTLKFPSPGWSEFSTGDTTLALRPASEKNPAGNIEVGFNVLDVNKFHEEMKSKGVSSRCRLNYRILAGCWRSLKIPKAHT